MKPFRAMNPVPLGAIGIGALVGLLAAAFNADDLPIIGAGDTYSAAFSEAGGLRIDDEVRIAGVRVGKVKDIALDGDHVKVTFKVDEGHELGSETAASIRIRTVLGQKYLALDPQGDGELEEGSEIPRSRTTAPFDVVAAFQGLATTASEIDTEQLAKAFDTISETFDSPNEDVRQALTGLSRLSRTISTRDAQLRDLLDRTRGVTQVLAERDEQFVQLLRDGDLVLRVVEQRRQLIHELLVNTSRLSQELTGLVRENRAEIGPALRETRTVLRVLQDNQDDLERVVKLLAPFVRVQNNTLGNGPWFDTFVQNLIPNSMFDVEGPQSRSGPTAARPNRARGAVL